MSSTKYFDDKTDGAKLTSSLFLKALVELNRRHPNSPIRVELKESPRSYNITYVLEEDGVLCIGIE